MASQINLHTPEGLSSFRRDHNVPDDVGVRLYTEGEVVDFPSIVVSSYMLAVVGLRFPLPSIFCHLLMGFHLPLGSCRPNLVRLFLGVSAVCERLGIFLEPRDVAHCYSLHFNLGEPYLRVGPSGRHLVSGIDIFHNKN